MDFHEIANAFPMLSDAELEELTADVKANGLIRPIVVFEDKILDGRNRYLASRKARLTPQLTTFVGDWDAATRYVISENLRRRHLSETQRALAAAKLARLKPGRPAKEILETGAIAPVSQGRAAEQMNVSRDSVKRAARVVSQGVPELVDAVEKDEIKVQPASVLANLPPDKQREVLSGGKKAVSDTVRELRARPKRQPTDNEKNLRQGRDAGMAIDQLSLALVGLKEAVQRLSTTPITPYVRESAEGFVAEMRTVAGWLETIIAGEGVPDSVPTSWLQDGRGE